MPWTECPVSDGLDVQIPWNTHIHELGSFQTFLLATCIAGIIQLFFGVIGAGVIGSYFPNAVIRGMLAAIGLILIMKQLPHAVGYGADVLVDETYSPDTPIAIVDEVVNALESISPGATIVSFGALLIIVLWDQLIKRGFSLANYIPGPLIAVIWGVVFQLAAVDTSLAISGQHLVSLPEHESLMHLLGHLVTPDFSQLTNLLVYVYAIQLAVIASIESLLSLEAIDQIDPLRRTTPPNQELKAQGIGNLISGLLGGLPITSVIVRSSANVNAGAKSKLSSIVHGILLLLSVLFLVEWINYIPLSALAAILITTGYKLAKPAHFVEMYRRGQDQLLPFLITIIAILMDDLLKGVAIGTVIGFFFVIKTNFSSSIRLTQKGSNYLIKFRKDVNFLNKPKLRKALDQIPANSSVLIDGSSADFIDSDIKDCIEDFISRAHLMRIPYMDALGMQGDKFRF